MRTSDISQILAALLLVIAPGALGDYVQMKAHSLKAYEGAKCLDGSPGLYYHVEGQSTGDRKWYIEMEGGGWCKDLRSCKVRSQRPSGSTLNDPLARSKHNPFFENDPQINPLMHDWNRVFFRYCDGFSFAGNLSDPVLLNDGKTVLHFRGKGIFEAGVADLLARHDLGKATDVVIGGCSAGGLSTLLHCDRWAERIQEHSPTAKVACAPESGFFIDYNKTSPNTYGDLMRGGLELHQPILPSNCLAHESDASRCVYAESIAKYVETPVFVMQPLFDDWSRGVVALSQGNRKEINEFGSLVQHTVLDVTKNLSTVSEHNGVFLVSCKKHCGGYDVEINGVKKPAALQRWYEQQGDVDSEYVYVQGREYQCEGCCLAPSPTPEPTSSPTVKEVPIESPSQAPSLQPSSIPSQRPTLRPSSGPSISPTTGASTILSAASAKSGETKSGTGSGSSAGWIAASCSWWILMIGSISFCIKKHRSTEKDPNELP